MLQKAKSFIIQNLIPSRIILLRGDDRDSQIYLTFDDGPCPEITDRLLDVLDRFEAKATFFVIGQYASRHKALLKEIHDRGHSIGNHSYNHDVFSNLPMAVQVQEITQTNEAIEQVTGSPCMLFRAPQGRWNLRLLWYTLRHRITATHWSVDSLDYRKEPADQIVQRLSKHSLKSGDILLFHDDNGLCVDALETLIPLWQSQGFKFGVL